MCGPACRVRRRRKLARRRRIQDLQDQRADERDRQRRCRESRRGRACHAPPSTLKPALLRAEMLEIWDEAMALSRTTLVRRLPALVRVSVPFAGTAGAP